MGCAVIYCGEGLACIGSNCSSAKIAMACVKCFLLTYNGHITSESIDKSLLLPPFPLNSSGSVLVGIWYSASRCIA